PHGEQPHHRVSGPTPRQGRRHGRGGDDVDDHLVLQLKSAKVEAAVDDARQAALSGAAYLGDVEVAGPVGQTARCYRHRGRGGAVVAQQAELRGGDDGDDAGGGAGVGVSRLDEVGAAGDRGRVGVFAVDGVGGQIAAAGRVGQDVVVEHERSADGAA